VIQRRRIGGHRGRPTAAPKQTVPPPASPPMAQPAETIDASAASATRPDDTSGGRGTHEPVDLSTQFDRILELLEDRILRELERRGGRFRGGF
jgi:hypothetical protein